MCTSSSWRRSFSWQGLSVLTILRWRSVFERWRFQDAAGMLPLKTWNRAASQRNWWFSFCSQLQGAKKKKKKTPSFTWSNLCKGCHVCPALSPLLVCRSSYRTSSPSASLLTLLTLANFWQCFKDASSTSCRLGTSKTWSCEAQKRDNEEVATWSGSRLMPAAVKQHPSLIFHSLSYAQAVSSPIVASLFMRSPIC